MDNDKTQTPTDPGPERWVPDALDQQEAYLADLRGQLHRPEDAPHDAPEDWRRCATCGADLAALFMCADAPTGRCGCPLYMIRDGEHLPHE